MAESPQGRQGGVPDAPSGNWVDAFAPDWLQPYARLARWDRPIGFWLLFWPCAFSLALVAIAMPLDGFSVRYLALMLVGAVLMRGAGCTLNDIVDAGIDAKVERTRNRPIPSGSIGRRQAALFLFLQALAGLLILLQFNWPTVLLGAASLVLIAIYPFMKRITWWPQFFLGLAFSWGALLGWSSIAGGLSPAPLILYAGSILWVIGYDTIYALQDVEDDALVGVKSTARLFGDRVKPAVALFYAGAIMCWGLAAWVVGARPLFLALLCLPAAILAWQVVTLDAREEGNALARFKANQWVGLTLTLALLASFYL
jgi:4-hydroxybenzoate polyprenyltransferase